MSVVMNNTSEHDLGQEMGVADAMGAMGFVRRQDLGALREGVLDPGEERLEVLGVHGRAAPNP